MEILEKFNKDAIKIILRNNLLIPLIKGEIIKEKIKNTQLEKSEIEKEKIRIRDESIIFLITYQKDRNFQIIQ